MFEYVIRGSPHLLLEAIQKFRENSVQIQKEYLSATQEALEFPTNAVMRPRSIIVYVGLDTRVNVLSDIMAKFLPNKCQLPYWS